MQIKISISYKHRDLMKIRVTEGMCPCSHLQNLNYFRDMEKE